MASGIFFQFHASHHAGVNLLGLGTILVLAVARVHLLMLQKQGAPALLFSTAKAAAQELYTTLGQLVTKWRLCSAQK